MIYHIGSFAVRSGNIRICDPCYTLEKYESHPLLVFIGKSKHGTWEAFCSKDENSQRISQLIAIHNSFTEKVDLSQVPMIASLGNDSGQMGIYDAKHFNSPVHAKRIIETIEMLDPNLSECPDKWLQINSRVTMGPMRAGVIPYGAVSESGYGDGVYTVQGYKVNDKYVLFAITFIG